MQYQCTECGTRTGELEPAVKALKEQTGQSSPISHGVCSAGCLVRSLWQASDDRSTALCDGCGVDLHPGWTHGVDDLLLCVGCNQWAKSEHRLKRWKESRAVTMQLRCEVCKKSYTRPRVLGDHPSFGRCPRCAFVPSYARLRAMKAASMGPLADIWNGGANMPSEQPADEGTHDVE